MKRRFWLRLRPERLLPRSGWSALLQMLGFAMIGGLILNVMPCVLPVISLKIFGFVSEAGMQPKKAFGLSMAFSLGIIGCFAALAAIVVLLASGRSADRVGISIPGFSLYRFDRLPGFCLCAESYLGCLNCPFPHKRPRAWRTWPGNRVMAERFFKGYSRRCWPLPVPRRFSEPLLRLLLPNPAG